MKIADAPPPGWYPDPAGGSRLRWWEGADWSDRFRARPPEMRAVPAGQASPGGPGAQHGGAWPGQVVQADQQLGHEAAQQFGGIDSAQLVEQVRMAARQEAQRASELFGQQARAATRDMVPLITEYTTKIGRVIRVLSTIAIVVLVLYVAFQIWAQDSLFDWIGDRIDNVTDDAATVLVRPGVTRR